MICPYCSKQIGNNNQFCPECGQPIVLNSHTESTKSYWGAVNKEDIDRSRKYKDIIDRENKNTRDRRIKMVITTSILLLIAISAGLGLVKLSHYQKKMMNQVHEQLKGKTFIAHASHVEGLGWIYHEYWQLTFKDEENLDYAYIETVGPREEKEKPKYKGTYSYTLSRSLFGNYTVYVNGTTYKLKVSDDNIPTGISREK